MQCDVNANAVAAMKNIARRDIRKKTIVRWAVLRVAFGLRLAL